jgi:hypothetical protein
MHTLESLRLNPTRSAILWTALPCLAILATGILLVRAGDPRGWVGVAAVGCFLPVIFYAIFPGTTYLELNGVGFTLGGRFGTHTIPWDSGSTAPAFRTSRPPCPIPMAFATMNWPAS